jgi:hypothetical protein
MVVLAFITLLIIVVVCLVLLLGQVAREQDQVLASRRRVEEIEQQTIRALFDAARESGAFRGPLK